MVVSFGRLPSFKGAALTLQLLCGFCAAVLLSPATPDVAIVNVRPHRPIEDPAMKFVLALSLTLLTAAAAHATCTAEVGAARANEYVRHCRDVSPATRPPCNAANACKLLLDEIRRGCKILAEDAPAYCRAYLGAR